MLRDRAEALEELGLKINELKRYNSFTMQAIDDQRSVQIVDEAREKIEYVLALLNCY